MRAKFGRLWSLGLMGNRGVETDRVVQALTAHLKDSDEDSRRWAVEGLALAGATGTIEPLLQTMHDDPSAIVRERAACGLAESGMFTPEQRMSAVPQLISYTDDPSLDAQTHAWAAQAWPTLPTSISAPTPKPGAIGTTPAKPTENLRPFPRKGAALAAEGALSMPGMIRMPLQNRERPIDLLEQHHSRQFMRQRHLSE